MQGRLTTFKSGFCFDVYSDMCDIYRHKKRQNANKYPEISTKSRKKSRQNNQKTQEITSKTENETKTPALRS